MELAVEDLFERFHNVCRFCLSDNDCLPIFLPDKSYNDKLQDGFEIIASKVDENDRLPNNICSCCLQRIADFINFEVKCSKSYEILEQVIQLSERSGKNNVPSLAIMNKEDCSLLQEYGENELYLSNQAEEKVIEVIQGQENDPESTMNKDYIFPDQMMVYDDDPPDELEEFQKDSEKDNEDQYIVDYAEDAETMELHEEGEAVYSQGFLKLEVEIATKVDANVDNGSEMGEFAESLEQLSDDNKKMFLEAANANARDWVSRGSRRIPIVECKFCNKTYRGRNTLRKHLKLHFKIKNYTCRFCPRSFSDRSSLRLHEYRHSTVKAFNCNYCDRCYYSQAELKQHCVLQHEERKFVCTVCCAKFPSKTILNDHSRVHMPDRPYICNICGYSFKRNRNLTRHLLCHEERNPKGKVNGCLLQKSVSCQYCTLLFEVPTELLQHMIDQHPQDYEQIRSRIHLCPYCNHSFAEFDKYLKHQNKHYVIPIITEGGKIYECGECGRQLRYKSLAQKHMASHSTKTVWKCPYEGCLKMYKHQIHYARHIQGDHESAFTNDTRDVYK